jgi:two-component system CheB/CheR fusion protein
MIYLTSEVQQKLVKLFHYSLEQDGVLLLGSSEAIPPAHDGFAPIDASLRLYRRLGAARNLTMASIEPTTRILPGAEHRRAVPKPHEPEDTSILPIIRQITPPAMILDRSGVEILRTFGRTGQFLAPVSRVSASTLPRAARAARAATRQPLAEVLRALARGRASSICEGLPNRRTRSIIRVTARRLRSPSSSRGQILVTFERLKLGKLTATNSTAEQRLTRALRRSEREVLALRQETLLSGEHLSAANEELQVVNEELQSANEELTTSKEETQSMNEELRSVNAELQSKLDNFSVVNSDLRNLLDSTDLAIVFLDSRLRIRRFTRQMAQVIRLIPGDVGRPVTDVKWDLVYPELAADIAEVLTTLVICEKEIRAAGNRWYALRILPYRTAENVIDGVVMTLADISKAKELEATLRAVASKPQSGSVDPSEA